MRPHIRSMRAEVRSAWGIADICQPHKTTDTHPRPTWNKKNNSSFFSTPFRSITRRTIVKKRRNFILTSGSGASHFTALWLMSISRCYGGWNLRSFEDQKNALKIPFHRNPSSLHVPFRVTSFHSLASAAGVWGRSVIKTARRTEIYFNSLP